MKRWLWILLILSAIYVVILFWPAVVNKIKQATAKTVVSQWLADVRQTIIQNYLLSFEEPWTGWILSIIAEESGGHANAYNPKDPSWGLMAITPPTLSDFNRANNKSYSIEDLKTPAVNLEVGIWYFQFLWKGYNKDYDKAIMAYNAGQGNIAAGAPYLVNVKQFLSLIQPQLS